MDAISDVSRGSEIFSSVPVFPPLPKPLNLDDLFGFSEAARKHLVEEVVETKYFAVNKVFINQVDSFTGKHIVSLFAGKNILTNQQYSKYNSNQSETKENGIDLDMPNIKDEGINCEKLHQAEPTPNLPSKEVIDYFEDTSFEERFHYDTSKLTVAEYYEMMELETVEIREEFIKEKLEKSFADSCEVNIVKGKLEIDLQNKTPHLDCHENELEIIGTLKNPNLENVDGVKAIIKPNDDSEFVNQIVTCGVIIYCVHEDLDQTVEASWVLNCIISFIKDQELTGVCSPIFVLVSTFMTWVHTKPLSQSEELPFIEKDYRKRKPHPNYGDQYKLEELFIKAKIDHSIRSVVIVSGIPYGHEENELRYLFEQAYCYTHLPIYSYGNNLLPLVHVENLAQIIKTTVSKIDNVTTPFIFAKDPVQNTLSDISKAISLNLGTEYCEFQRKEFAFINDMISQDIYNKVTSGIFLESCYPLFKEKEIQWKYKSGFIDNINSIINEFIDAQKYKPLRIIFYGVALSSRLKKVIHKVSNCCNIPCINPETMVIEYFEETIGKQTKFEGQKLLVMPETTNLSTSKSFELPTKLILCGDENSFEKRKEILNKLSIQNPKDIKKLNESDKLNIVAKKLETRPYIYHGYILEDFPQSLKEANRLFKTSKVYSSTNQISIVPDYVIFYNKISDSKNQISDLQGNDSQRNKGQGYRPSLFSNALDEGPLFSGKGSISDKFYSEREEGKQTTAKYSSITVKASIAIYNEMFTFFSNLDQHCQAIYLDVQESDDEDTIFNKTIDLIKNNPFIFDRDYKNSSIFNEQVKNVKFTISNEEKQVGNLSENGEPQVKIENEDIDELRESEEIILAIRSHPLISYLINFISPTLTNGILEVSAQIFKDPIEYLAEYIFKNNPDGRMMPQSESKLEKLIKDIQKKQIPHVDSKACLA